MRIFLLSVVMLVFVSVFTLGARALLRAGNRKIWNFKILEKISKYLPYLGWSFFLFFGISLIFDWQFLIMVSAAAMAMLIVISAILMLTLPVSLLINKTAKWIHSFKKESKPQAVAKERRLFIKTAAASLPVFMIGTSTNGFAGAFQKVRIPKIEMKYKDLPDALDGFRIWHLSDLHLGYYYFMDDLEQLMINAEGEQVDLVLITGDVSDDLTKLTDVLKLIDQKPAKYPKFVSLGNHEYYRGIKEVYRRIEASPIPLLKNNNHIIQVEDTKLLIGGLDDPVHMHADNNQFFDQSLKQLLNDKPEFDFGILMSHRPKALDMASEYNMNLVLSGHTHGGQIGFNNRSMFEIFAKNAYLWGKYRKNGTHLYTSSGVGQWFPFRLGCPAEAPIITLKKL
jgi:uncharacterized protein